ncbi:DUF1826 domain-containing protein [Nitrosomonas sp.]|uniref:DUF1826 domain-containing protein n=1 Tax=Nitrosomonas sp. TaxID=42353 RepID=UPI0028509831|nr:DUF1826 domain-containing protein [Nitrosomonas sp.]MDR4515658.1 DUF1826 domain-containing protein [Nitrosomonas sp.]
MEIVSAKTGHSKSQLRPESSVCISGNAPEILTRIYDTHIKLCIYKRTMSANVKDYAIFLKNTFHTLLLTQIVSLHNLNDLLCVSLPEHQYRQSFIEDVYTVVEMFACLFELQQIGFRLCVLNKTMCPRFHTDRVPCRLITSYSGKGTEWLDCMTYSSNFLEALNQKPENSDSVQRLNSGDIALFKGDKWEGHEHSGVIHRSPDIDAEEMRLLLSLDIIHQK